MDKTHTRRVNYKILYDFYCHYIRDKKSGAYTYSEYTSPMNHHDELVRYYGEIIDEGSPYDEELNYHGSACDYANSDEAIEEATDKIIVYPKWIGELQGKELSLKYNEAR